ncbi:MAG: ATP phosphoribosyltransferase [Patescibacteria group bacterium]
MKNKLNYFETSKFKICLQREGHISRIAKNVLSKGLQARIPAYNRRFRTFSNSTKNGEIGIIYIKDKMVCDIVKSGFVDLGVVGSDRIHEGNFENRIVKIKTLSKISWPLVIAIPLDSSIKSMSDIKTIATQFPKSVNSYLDSVDLREKIRIIKIQGSAEAMPYGKWLGKRIDAIADISITGKSLRNNSLIRLGKPIAVFHPVIIANKKSIKLKNKMAYYRQFIKK